MWSPTGSLSRRSPWAAELKLRWRSKLWPDIAVVEGPADLGSALQQLPSVQTVQIQQQPKRAAEIPHGAKLLSAVCETTVPRIAVMVRKAYGGGYLAMSGAPTKPDAMLERRTPSHWYRQSELSILERVLQAPPGPPKCLLKSSGRLVSEPRHGTFFGLWTNG